MSTPGDDTPGLRTPQFETPGARSPGDAADSTVTGTGVAVDATGTTTLGTVDGDRTSVEEVRVNATATDFNFNVNVDGTAIFSANQSPSGTSEEVFYPDEDLRITTDKQSEDVVFEVTSASGTGGATADVDVQIITEDEV